jgi:hypothetical protein
MLYRDGDEGVKVALALLSAALLALAACSETGGTRSSIAERDSSGIAIVENAGPYPLWHLGSIPEVRVGTIEGDSAYQFHRVQFAGRLTDGRVVVADAGSSQVRWYSPSGVHRSTAGRRGEGPQEFLSFGNALLTSNDTLIVYDPRSRRATWFSPREAYVGDLSLRDGPAGAVTILGATPDRRLAVAVSTPSFNIQRPDLSYTRDTLTVVLHSSTTLDTVVLRAGTESSLWVQFEGGQPTRMQQMGMPFAHQVLAGSSADQIVLAVGDSHELEIRDWNGTLRRIARRLDAPTPVLTDEHLERYVRHDVQAASARGASNLGTVEENAKTRLAVIPDGHTVPSFDTLITGADGRIWLRDFAPPWSESAEYNWTVYDSTGRVERRVSTPSNLNITHVRDGHVTGVIRDSLDVEYVVVYRLERVEDGS